MCHDLTQRLLLWRIRADCRPVYMFVNTHTHTCMQRPDLKQGPVLVSGPCRAVDRSCCVNTVIYRNKKGNKGGERMKRDETETQTV